MSTYSPRSTVNSGRGRWEKRTRHVEVELVAGADGVQVAGTRDMPAAGDVPAEPCYDCACCASWAAMLEQLRAAALAHKNPHPVLGVQCPTEHCLICALGVSW